MMRYSFELSKISINPKLTNNKVMKKILFSILTFGAFYINASAQTQGSISIGGSFNLWFQNPKTVYTNPSETVDGVKTTHFTLLPSIEYYANEQVSIGLGIGYDLTRDKTVNTNSTSIQRTGIFYFEPFARKFFKVGDRVDFFGELGLSLGFGNETDEVSSGNTTVSNKYAHSLVSFGISPGILYHISDKVALETSFGFFGYQGSSTEISANQKDKTNDFGLNLSTSTLNFGFRYYIK